ncbi:MAG: HNH endonuclease [Planctomycetota bacterium]
MHRQLITPPPAYCIDHINRNGLDNRRANLRLATPSQNAANSKPRNPRSGYKGVWFDKRKRKFRAAIWHNNKRIHLGYFDAIRIPKFSIPAQISTQGPRRVPKRTNPLKTPPAEGRFRLVLPPGLYSGSSPPPNNVIASEARQSKSFNQYTSRPPSRRVGCAHRYCVLNI